MLHRIMFGSLLMCSLLLAACGKEAPATAATATTTTAAAPAPAPAPASAANKNTIKIGFSAPLTGSQAHLGKDLQFAAQLAIDEINATHPALSGTPVTFELLVEDDMADPRTATTVAQKFVDQAVSGVIGHLNSGTTIPASKIYHSNNIVQISPSATAIAYTAQGYANAFRVMANDGQQGKALGEYAVNALGAKQIAIIDDRTAYGQGLADEFAKAAEATGATIVAREYTSDKASDFNAILTTIKGKAPQLLFYGGMDGQGAPMVKQMHALGLTIPFMGGDGVRSEEFIKLAGVDAEGVIGSLPGVPFDEMPNGAAFRDKFVAKYGPIQLYAPYAYDAVHIMVSAMLQTGSADSAKYLPAVAGIHHSGVTANIDFDNKGDLKSGAVTLYKSVGGQWQVLQTLGGVAPPLPAGYVPAAVVTPEPAAPAARVAPPAPAAP